MQNQEQRSDGFTAVEERYSGYTVNDKDGGKIGKVDDLFVDENDQPEYFGVKMGFLGSKSTLIPADIATVDEERGFIEVSQPKDMVKDGPAFDDDREITPEYENEIRSYYGLDPLESNGDRGSYGAYDNGQEQRNGDDADSGHAGPGMAMGDTESGEFRGDAKESEGVNQTRGSDLEDEDELRVQRSEEELHAGTREREAGSMNVRKRVRTEREQITVPTKREQVNVDRVQVDDRDAAEGEIGEQNVNMPVTEEEVVTDKQAKVKEEIRVKKDVVNEEEVVEGDVRKEEVEIDDDTEHGKGLDDDSPRPNK